MTQYTFVLCAWHFYTLPDSLNFQSIAVRHIIGGLLILIHIWTSFSVYEALGEFGWFYGDFFINEYESPLVYTGIFHNIATIQST